MTFQAADFGVLATLILLEGLLSADNALVLALQVRHLPDVQQQKALSLGMLYAFVLRIVGIAVAGFLIRFWWLCGLGALYLLGLAAKHFFFRPKVSTSDSALLSGPSFRKTALLVGMTDIVFAVDSILVAVALVSNPSKLWLVYAGGFLGLLLLRVGSSAFLQLLKRYPALDHTAYALVAWAGVKLLCAAGHMSPWHFLPELPKAIFWSGFVLILLFGALYAKKMDTDSAN